jgi:hypothetical protein
MAVAIVGKRPLKLRGVKIWVEYMGEQPYRAALCTDF